MCVCMFSGTNDLAQTEKLFGQYFVQEIIITTKVVIQFYNSLSSNDFSRRVLSVISDKLEQ